MGPFGALLIIHSGGPLGASGSIRSKLRSWSLAFVRNRRVYIISLARLIDLRLSSIKEKGSGPLSALALCLDLATASMHWDGLGQSESRRSYLVPKSIPFTSRKSFNVSGE